MRICIGIPNPQFIHPDFALVNLPQIIAHAKSSIPDLELFIKNKEGVMTSSNRNFILKQCLEEDIDAILWLDTDQIYPADILKLMVDSGKDIIGSIYYRRTEPHDPNVFVDGNNPVKPYRIVDTTKIQKGQIVEVDGLGFGGMFVKMSVYQTMGDDKWMRYGRNFGIPEEMEDQLSHDLVFCRTAKQYGYKIYVHGSVRCGHIGEKLVTDADWQPQKPPKIAVLMPTVNIEKAEQTTKILQERAGMDVDCYILDDYDKRGYVANCNNFVKENQNYDFYVPVTDDIFPSRNWLKDAYDLHKKTGAKLVGFNDGKWKGSLACCALVERDWMSKNYDGNLYYPGYFGHYNDTELTILALQDKVYAYDPDISLIEVDYEKDKKQVNAKDRALFAERKKTNFDGRVTNTELLNIYS